MSELDQLSINALRFLAVDAVDKAKSGHPGAPLGDSPIAYLLFHKYMRHNPKNSHWSNRDRFVLSNGHASADRKSTRLNSSHSDRSRMPSSA